MTTVYHADVGIEGIIYLVIVVLWAVAQVFIRGKKKSGETPQTPRQPHAGPVSDEWRKIFETLTGQKAEREEPPTPRVIEALPVRKPQPKRRASIPEPALPSMELEPAIVMPAKVEFGQTQFVSSASPLGVNVRGLTVRMKAISLPTMRLGLVASLAGGGARAYLPDLKSEDGLRQAMLSRIILGPPKALEDDPVTRHFAW